MASVQRRARYEVEQEYIVNDLLVTINKREKIYFERVEDFQAFYKIWVEDEDSSIEECLRSAIEQSIKKTALNP